MIHDKALVWKFSSWSLCNLAAAVLVCGSACRAAELQWGFDFTSGDVVSVTNDGTGGTGLSGIVFNDTPFYTGDIPAAVQLQNTTGIGSIDTRVAGATPGGGTLRNAGTVADLTDEAGLIAAGGITIEAWFKPTVVGGRGTILGIGDALVLEDRAGTGFVLLTNSSSNPTPTYAISDEEKAALGWTHLAGTFAVNDLGGGNFDNTSTLYINGVQVDQETGLNFVPVFDAVAARNITVGSGSNFPQFRLEGLVFEPRITLDVLTPAEFTTTGVVVPSSLEINVDRESGQMTMANNTGQSFTILGYSVLSGFGALNAGQWLSIAENYDAGNPGPDQVDPDNNWTLLVDASSRTDMSEAELEGGNGATVADGQSIDMGTPWIRQFNEDLEVEILLDDGSIVAGLVNYVGNSDQPYAFADIAGGPDGGPDGALDLVDWNEFKAGYGSNLTGLSSAEAYLASDLTGDGQHTLADFLAFRDSFDAVNGQGAFASLVPEPTAALLLLLGAIGIVSLRKRSRLTVALLVAAVLGLSPFRAARAEFDGFNVPSTTFANQYFGNQIFDGTAAIAPWADAGGIDLSEVSLNGQNIVWNQTTNNGWFEQNGPGTSWGGATDGTSSWTVEVNLKLGTPVIAGDNEIVLWTDDGGNNQIFVMADNLTYNFVSGPAAAYDTSSNSDAFHTFRVAYDGDDGMYHLWRDDLQLTPLEGVPRRGSTTNDRLILGDCCTNGGQADPFLTNNAEINYVRFDNTGAYSPAGPIGLTLEVNEITGVSRLVNNSPVEFDVNGYSITSAGDALLSATWTSLESQGIGDNGIPNDGIGFEVLTGTPGELAEANLLGSSLMAPGGPGFSLGRIVDPTQEVIDLELSFSTIDGVTLAGVVELVPSSGVNGDFNNDNFWDCEDIDALTAAIAGGGNDPSFDMNGDGVVDAADITDAGVGWLAVGGANNAAQTGGNAFIAGDGNLDGVVDVSDFNIFNNNKFTNIAAWCSGDYNADGVVDVSDFNIFNNNKFTSSMGGGVAVPEPTGWLLIGLAAISAGVVIRRPRGGERTVTMRGVVKTLSFLLMTAVAVSSLSSAARADAFVDRLYQFGDDSFENGSVGAVLGVNVPAPFNDGRTLDSAGIGGGTGDLKDLILARDDMGIIASNNDPIYVDTFASGRPGATSGQLGARFDGDGDGLTGQELNSPNDTWRDLWEDNNAYPRNWTGIFSRGFQLWVRPETSGDPGVEPGIGGMMRQDIVTDTGEHGAFISSNDNWGLQFDDTSIESAVPAVAGEWTHVMERTLSGALGGALLVNGVAVAAQGTFYDPEDGDMSVGANQDGTGNYYKGEVDEMKMFLWGDNTFAVTNPGEPSGADWGQLDLNEDNDWIAMQLQALGVTDSADVNLDGSVDSSDVDAFVPNWRDTNLVMGVLVGDWISRQNGDLNYDGIVDLDDAYILHEGLLAATGEGLDFSLLPEPAGAGLLWIGLFALGFVRQRRAGN